MTEEDASTGAASPVPVEWSAVSAMAGRSWLAMGVTAVLVAVQAAAAACDTRGAASTSATSGRAAITCPTTTTTALSRAPGAGRTVALSFDDGPGPSTNAILSTLADRHVRATFFNLGQELAGHARALRRMVKLGAVLGNHTWDHRSLTSLPATAAAAEIDRTTRETVRLTGVRPCVLRPPYGAYDHRTLELAVARGLAVWTWSVDTEDWKAVGSASDYWVERIVRRAEAGLVLPHPVILLHDSAAGTPATLRALGRIITIYRRHGYRFVGL
jgi:peptidoglycan/xylan/chitin deacetylase (PgdA/CDA1 family)